VRYGKPNSDNSGVQVSETFQGIQMAQDVFCHRKVRPDGIIVTNDLMAQGVLMTLPKLGVVLNKDVVIATHANRGSAVLHGYEDEIIRMEYDPAEIVEVLFEMLETQMEGESVAVEQVLIRPKLKVAPRLQVKSGTQEGIQV
jgi:DNA-binding LacI/PurR family transcriptional regulator